MRKRLGLAAVIAMALAAGCSKQEAARPGAPADNGTVGKGRLERAGESVGETLKGGAQKAGEIVEKGAVETGKALDKASEKTGDVLIKTGKWLRNDNTTDNNTTGKK